MWWLVLLLVVAVWLAYLRSESYRLTCVLSGVNGATYCVRDRDKVSDAADLLARVADKCGVFVNALAQKWPKREDVLRLQAKYDPQRMVEILPTSEFTAYSENKGDKVALCLNKNDKSDAGNNQLVDESTLMFVALHELAHIMTESEGHKQAFWQHFKFLLVQADELGVYRPVDYKQAPTQYCGMTLTDNPYYDM